MLKPKINDHKRLSEISYNLLTTEFFLLLFDLNCDLCLYLFFHFEMAFFFGDIALLHLCK